MRKRVFIAVLIISFCISAQGCGKISNQNNADNANNETQASTAPSTDVSKEPDNNIQISQILQTVLIFQILLEIMYQQKPQSLNQVNYQLMNNIQMHTEL